MWSSLGPSCHSKYKHILKYKHIVKAHFKVQAHPKVQAHSLIDDTQVFVKI